MIIEKIVPYEILIRFSDAGTLQGAHLAHKRILENIETGERIAEQVTDLRPLGIVGDEHATTLRSVLGDALTAALRDIENLQSAQAIADKEIESLREQLNVSRKALAAAEKIIELMREQSHVDSNQADN